MKIIYSGLQHDKLNPKGGYSFEHNNFYKSLKYLSGVEVIYFPYERILEVGREKMNQELLEAVRREKPDLFFAFMYTDELDFKTLDEIKKITKNVAWFSDDHWRFDNYSKYYAPHFSWVVTTYSKAVEKYKNLGMRNVIHSQWAANIHTYRPCTEKQDINISFVGNWNANREKIIKELRKKNIKVQVWGHGWNNGRVKDNNDVVRIISGSKISLGLNPPSSYFGIKPFVRLFFRRSGKFFIPDFWHFFGNLREWRQKRIPQIKARTFEIPACRSLLMTGYADNLEDYYKVGEEIVVYKDINDLAEKIRYYLEHPEERKKIAEAGYQRILKDHTYEKRFSEIFKILGL